MASYISKCLVIPALFLVACTPTGQTTASPSPITISTPAPTLAPISVLAEPGRGIALPVHTGSGGAQLRVRPLKGQFELMVSCIGGGSAIFILGDARAHMDCNGALAGYELETGKVADTLRIQANGVQRWRVAVQAGHTPME